MVEIYVNIDKCTGCGDCVKACPPEILFLNANYCNVRENLVPECLGCQSCVVVCPSAAISIKDQLESWNVGRVGKDYIQELGSVSTVSTVSTLKEWQFFMMHQM